MVEERAKRASRNHIPYADRRPQPGAEEVIHIFEHLIETVSGSTVEFLHGHRTSAQHHRGDRACPCRKARRTAGRRRAARARTRVGTTAPLPGPGDPGPLGPGRPARRGPGPARRCRRTLGGGVRTRRPGRRPGISHDAARQLLADALELAYRLPRLWDLVRSGEIPAWRARLIARETVDLSVEAALFADRLIAATPAKISRVHAGRLVQEAAALLRPRPRASPTRRKPSPSAASGSATQAVPPPPMW